MQGKLLDLILFRTKVKENSFNRIVSLWFPKLGTTTTSTTTTTAAPDTSVERFDEGTVDFNDFITESPDIASDESEDSNENKLEDFNAIFRR